MLNKNLKKLRQQYDISAKRIAKYLQVSEQDVLDWEQGVSVPSSNQIHELCDLFDISYDDLIGEEDKIERRSATSKKPKQRKTKTKTKKKKQKGKTKNNKKIEKRRTWPLVLLFVIVIGFGSVAGFLYWKYGDEYSITKKQEYSVDALAGVFHDESRKGNQIPVLSLLSDASFTLATSTCEVEESYQGTWDVKENIVTLTTYDGITFTLRIKSSNALTFQLSSEACGPKKGDTYIRGDVVNAPIKEEENEVEEEEVETPTSFIQVGDYSGDNSTLRVSSVASSSIVFTLQSFDPNNEDHVASLSDITGVIDGNNVTFEFFDDGYGSKGYGTISFSDSKAVFDITLTSVVELSEWTIYEQGTLIK